MTFDLALDIWHFGILFKLREMFEILHITLLVFYIYNPRPDSFPYIKYARDHLEDVCKVWETSEQLLFLPKTIDSARIIDIIDLGRFCYCCCLAF